MRRKRLKAWQVALGITVAFGLCGWGTSWYATYRAQQALNHALARLQELGFATEFSRAEPSVPDDSNAAIIYERAAREMAAMHIRRPPMFITKTNEVDYYAGVQAYASAMKPVWPLIDQALLRPNCKFRIMNDESTPYMNNSLFEFVPLQESLRSVARLASHDGDFARAQSMLQKSVRMIGQLKQPSLESLLARQRMSSATLDELDKEIQEWGERAEFRVLATKTLDSIPSLPTVFSSFAVSIPEQRQIFVNIRHYDDEKTDTPMFNQLQRYALRFEVVRLSAQTKALNHWADALTVMKRARGDWRLADQAIGQMNRSMSVDTSITGVIAYAFSDVYEGIGLGIGRTEARICLTRTALELYAIRSKTGTFPEALPRPVVDPLSGNLIYRREGSGFRLYSVGLNGIDNGGKKSYPKHSDDVEFAGYWRP